MIYIFFTVMKYWMSGNAGWSIFCLIFSQITACQYIDYLLQGRQHRKFARNDMERVGID